MAGALGRAIDFLTSRRVTVVGDSMLPGMRAGEHLVFSGRRLREAPVRRGEVVLVRAPGGGGRLDVKRVVGLPGETVRVTDATVCVDGQALDEPYLRKPDSNRTDRQPTAAPLDGPPTPPAWDDPTTAPLLDGETTTASGGGDNQWMLGANQLVVLSDNRLLPGAVDSRSYGPITVDLIVGKLVRRF